MVELLSGLDQPVSDFVQTALLIDEAGTIEQAANLMLRNQSGSIIVTKEGDPVGILTEWDILTRVVAQGKDVTGTRVSEVMSSPLIKIESKARLGDAMRIMINRGIRRLAVMHGGQFVGTITQSYVIGNRRQASSPLPIIEPAKGSRYPYCDSNFEDSEALSKHIDEAHIGTLMLEMASRKH